MTVPSGGDLLLSGIFVGGAFLFLWNGLKGLRGSALWIDTSDATDAWPEATRVVGRAARALGFVYLAGCVVCLVALLTLWI